MRIVLALLLAAFVAPAFAQSDEDVADGLWYYSPLGTGTGHQSAHVACETAFQERLAAQGLDPATNHFDGAVVSGTPPTRTAQCMAHSSNSNGHGPSSAFRTVYEVCPSGFQPGSGVGHQHCHRPTTCASRAGQSKKFTVTRGWARSNNPDTDDLVVELPFPSSPMCDGSCLVALSSVDSAWRSQVPASNGLHRVSTTFNVTYTGSACQGGAPTAADPNSAPAPCPGYTGSVNGRPVCVGTPTTPLPQLPRPPGTPPEGHGNPGAGDKPTTGPGSGEGSGATPAVGNGGNAGGGSNAAVPGGGSEGNGQGNGTPVGTGPDGSSTGGSGPGSEPIEVETCGLPGKPPCRLDETGTPTGDGAYTSATNGVNSNRDSAVQGINDAAGAGGKSTGWTFSFALPTGCSDIPLAAFAPYISGVNVCAWQDVIHDLMSMIWLAVTVWCCIGMVGRAIGGGN